LWSCKDHPRMRGEEVHEGASAPIVRGSPLHARGRGDREVNMVVPDRITPACAGKSSWLAHPDRAIEDHPRMRGEELVCESAVTSLDGSPPHTRGRAVSGAGGSGSSGITPACAGKRFMRKEAPEFRTDHPRMRGEENVARHAWDSQHGSPPHARGRGECLRPQVLPRRITPACAGKSTPPAGTARAAEDHPRMRGEERVRGAGYRWRGGSPPHARGRGARRGTPLDGPRITPACAGKSPSAWRSATATPDHPRMRGEEPSCSFGGTKP